jgi:hypothetical protein
MPKDTELEILRIRGALVKNLLNLMRQVGKQLKQSFTKWTYHYPISTLKHILLGKPYLTQPLEASRPARKTSTFASSFKS